MNQHIETPVTKVSCLFCNTCEPWVLCKCYTCGQEWWRRVTLARRWCDACLEREIDVARLLLVTGHEQLGSNRYFYNCAEWANLVLKRAEDISFSNLECSRTNLVPAIWSVLKKDWNRTKERCKKRFAWKVKKGRKLL